MNGPYGATQTSWIRSCGPIQTGAKLIQPLEPVKEDADEDHHYLSHSPKRDVAGEAETDS